MRNDDHGAVAIVEHALEPADGVDIEVIGGLVEQHDIGICEQRLRQQHAQLPARRDSRHRPGMLFQRNIQTQQQLTCTGLGAVAVQLGELDFQLRHLHAFCLAHLRQRIDAVALLLDGPQLFMPHDDGIQHAEFLEGELVLAQLAKTLVGIDRDITGSRLQIAAEDAHQGRFAAAVGADQAVAVPLAEAHGDIFKQGLRPELHGEIGGSNHGVVPTVSEAALLIGP